MTWKSATTQTRRLPPSHRLWTPHAYQVKAVDFLVNNGAAALFADMGTGKSAAALAAFSALKKAGVASKLLIIAPRRTCQLTWWQESQVWTDFRHLKFAWLHDSRAPWDIDGSPRKKEKELLVDADIYLINPEGVAWLYKKFYDHKTKRAKLPFDTVCVDESTAFKNYRAKRSKILLKLTEKTPRIWLMTGTPMPNGYDDLFGQILLLDGGASLGRFYTHFRDKYFAPDDYMGYSYKLKPGAAEKIEAQIAPLVLRIDADDWLDMPELIDNPIKIRLDDPARELYDELKKEMLISVPDGSITAANAAALYSKLAQLANGAIYMEAEMGQPRRVVHVHDAKLEALDDLLDQMGGAPLLLAYEFNHDLERLKAWWMKRTKKELRYLGKGVTDRQVAEIERDWNANQIPLLAVHPQSSGHGLNFQKGGAQHICWFSATWNFELYDQLIHRILRQGNTSAHVVNHLLLVENSIDELKYAALAEKDMTQERFLQALNTAFDFEPTPAAGTAVIDDEETTMAWEKLKRKSEVAEPAPAPAAKAAPKGWKATATPTVDDTAQRAAVQEKLRGPNTAEDEEIEPPVDAAAAFSPELQAKLAGEEVVASKPAEVPKNRRKDNREPAPAAQTGAYYSINVGVEISFDVDSNPVPRINAQGSLTGSFDAAYAADVVRVAELAASAAEAATNKIVEAIGGE